MKRKLCTIVTKFCVFLFTENCALLFTDYTFLGTSIDILKNPSVERTDFLIFSTYSFNNITAIGFWGNILFTSEGESSSPSEELKSFQNNPHYKDKTSEELDHPNGWLPPPPPSYHKDKTLKDSNNIDKNFQNQESHLNKSSNNETITTTNTESKPFSSGQNYEYKTYFNRDREYQIDYPIFFKRGASSENSDGRIFTCQDGKVKINVYSSYAYSTIYKMYNEDLNDRSLNISYKVLKPTWYVLSGIKFGKVFYKKVYQSTKLNDQFRTVWIEYSQTYSSMFNTIIPRMVSSFRDI